MSRPFSSHVLDAYKDVQPIKREDVEDLTGVYMKLFAETRKLKAAEARLIEAEELLRGVNALSRIQAVLQWNTPLRQKIREFTL